MAIEGADQVGDLISFATKEQLGSFRVQVLDLRPDADNEKLRAWVDKHDAINIDEYIETGSGHDWVRRLVEQMYFLPSLRLEKDVWQDFPKGAIVFTAQGACFSSEQEVFFQADEVEQSAVGKVKRKESLTKDLKHIQSQLASAQVEVDTLESDINEDSAKIKEIDTSLQSQNKGVISVVSEFEGLRQQDEHKLERLENARTKIYIYDDEEKHIIERRKSLKETKASLGLELKNLKKAIADEKNSAGGSLQEISDFRDQISDQKIELAKKEARAQVLTESFSQTQSQLERIQDSISRRYAQRENYQEDIKKAASDRERCKVEIQQNIGEKETLEDQYAEQQSSNADVIAKQRKIEVELKKFRNENEDLNRKISESEVKIERHSSQIESVRDQAQEKYQVELENLDIEIDEDYQYDQNGTYVTKLRARLERIGPINMMAIEEFELIEERETFILKQRDEVLKSIDLLNEAIVEIEETSKDKFLVIFHTVNREFQELFPILFPTGEAYVKLVDESDPLNSGVEILCRLPGKKLQRLQAFSGGEKALTAMALIFALLKTKPTPFCFLDEVDAPLDEANVVRYNKVLTALSKRFQFICITHNRRTMEILDTLYGITMQEPGVSKVVGVDMSKNIPEHLKNAFKRTGAQRSAIQ